MPTYNVSRYIERSIYSCLGQHFKSYEIIVVDDCGSDNSIEIAEAIAEEDSRLRIVRHTQNLGTYHARKTGVMEAKGEFILFLDPDDMLEVGALSSLYKVLSSYPSLDVLLFDSKYIPDYKFYQSKSSVPTGIIDENIPKNVLKHKNLNYGTPGKLYSLKVLKNSYLQLSVSDDIRLIYGEDALLFSSVLSFSKLVVGCNEKLYRYYRNESSITEVTRASSIKYNIEQLKLVLSYIYKSESKIDIVSVRPIINRIEVDILLLRKKLLLNDQEYFCLMFNILKKTKSWKVFLCIILFLFSFSKIRQ